MNYSLTTAQAKELISNKLSHFFGVTPEEATYEHYYKAVAMVVRDMLTKGRAEFAKESKKTDTKKVYYLSMEFLMGRSLKNNLFNLNLTSTMEKALSSFGIKLDKLFDCEPDAGLGNGGLGRLAACYLDGLATQGYNGMGYSILYEYGIFKQKIIEGWQTELPDFWLPGGEAHLVERPESAQEIRFEGWVEDFWDTHYHHVELKDYTPIQAVPYDLFVPGKDGKAVSVLRLWSAKAPGFDMENFNQGNYLKALEQNAMAEVISKVLYPSDNHYEGKSLRLKQQYFLVSASIQDIVARHLRTYGSIENFAEKNAIHINDTHPTLAIPELMRIFLDECGYGWDDAWRIVSQTCAYTNHTVMKEALECWSEELFKRLIPRIYQITKEIDNRYRSYVWSSTYDADYVERTAVISGGSIRMANLCVAACHTVNGVSALHSQILKDTVFNDFYKLTPEKFTNVTNGIAHRRWLNQSNPELTEYLTSLIGDGFTYYGDELLRLRDYKDNDEVLEKLEKIKFANKQRFAKLIKQKQGIELDPNSIFDVQVKRLHEYKRQHLNALQIVSRYLAIKENPDGDFVPHTYIFAAKAAPGYIVAKRIINFICEFANLVNNDPDVRGRLKVVFVEDYNVTMAETLMPAADISEQISLAGTEASGTGNMKLMLNGAITLGTMDGANIEIHDAVGEDNIVIFGMRTPEVNALKPNYNPHTYYENNAEIRKVVDFISKGINGKQFPDVSASIIHHDPYMVLADFADYRKAQLEIDKLWADRKKWNQMSLMNISGAGVFAADRAINEYAANIWHTAPVVKPEAPKAKAKAGDKPKAKAPAKSKAKTTKKS
ncbi:MAG: glycogen/starch/alpha-glucan phosphorylase [Clostridia bacterium]|nr:glycogen/starch/alpha-glucan phosphorylase [Clostridia bacterium]